MCPHAIVQLLENIIVSGGLSLLRGFVQRLNYSLGALTPASAKQKFVVPDKMERINAPWIGGSILSSLGTFQQMWISKGEYDESGPTIVHRKCF